MTSDVRREAAFLKAEFERGSAPGADRLADFADKYASDRNLMYEALLLRRDVVRGTAARSDVASRATAILDAVVAEHEQSIAVRATEATPEPALSAEPKAAIPRGVVFECQNLAKTYKRDGFSLHDVSFAARFGEITGVVGRNGNGKTTLFRLIVGELTPTSGTLTFPAIQGTDPRLHWDRIRQQIAYVPQELPRWFGSLKTNLHYEAATHGLLGAANERSVDYVIERLGLADELDNRWHELAGGFKLRFALARALVWKPKLLVLDEPLANLDFTAQQVVLKDLRHLTNSLRHPLSVLVSSQHLHEIEEVSNNLLFLEQGQVSYSGPVEKIGERRTRNTFELGGPVDRARLRTVLSGSEYQSIYHNGVAFVVEAALTVSAASVLRTLLDAGIELDYFRDISRSAKSLFDETAAR